MAREQGNEAVHACLAEVDPESAERLHPNNLKRVIRALEVYEQTGMTIGEMNRLHKRPEPKYQAIKLGLCPKDRQTLYHRIDSRVDDMIRDGLIDETRYIFGKMDFLRERRRRRSATKGAPWLSGGQRNPRKLYRAVKTPKQKLCKKAAYLAEKG